MNIQPDVEWEAELSIYQYADREFSGMSECKICHNEYWEDDEVYVVCHDGDNDESFHKLCLWRWYNHLGLKDCPGCGTNPIVKE